MQRRFSRAIVTSCVLGGWLSLVAPVVAQHAQPSVSVVTFEGTGAPREARDAMADELAARLVDTGHFRVLHREWLPHESDEMPALDVLRAAAQSVNVDYLVLGTIRQSTRVPPPQSSVMTSRGFGQVLSRPILLPIVAPPQRARQQTTVVVTVRVVDVRNADVVRTATAQRAYFSNAGSPAPFLGPVASHPATLAAAIATMAARPKSPSTRLTKDWRKAVQEVALQLDARGVPASGRR
jgi:curli biogenesis system outer membrane secretion channel CsgG